jgi:hypothetical protein
MKNLSMPRLTGSSSECDNSTSLHRANFAAERAQVLFGCYRKGEANDPETYVAAVAAVLATYPEETIRYVTDPRTGIPAKINWMPNVGEVRQACDDHYGPTRRAIEREASERRQLEERKRLAPPAGPKKTYEEIVQDCRSRGLMIGGGKKAWAAPNITEVCDRLGITREEFDALPDAK